MAKDRKKLERKQASDPVKQISRSKAKGTNKSISLPPSDDQSWYMENFRWSQRSMDHEYEGDWDWNLSSKEVRLILSHLEEMSQKTWNEIAQETAGRKSRAKSHSQSVEDIVSAARERLPELQLDVEELYRIRVGYSERLWGYRQRGCFHVLWFDRHHKIYDD